MKPARKRSVWSLIIVSHLEVQIVSVASAQVPKESGQIPSDRRWFLNRGEVSAAGKDCPALDVVHALDIRAWWLALGNGLVRKDAKRRGRADVSGGDRVPAIVPIERNQSNCVLLNFVQGCRSLMVAST